MIDTKTFKIIMVGDAAVGKTCIIKRFAEGTFEDKCGNTIGVDFKVKNIEFKGQTVKLQIWDTAGQQRYRNMTDLYFKGAQGVILVFDLSN